MARPLQSDLVGGRCLRIGTVPLSAPEPGAGGYGGRAGKLSLEQRSGLRRGAVLLGVVAERFHPQLFSQCRGKERSSLSRLCC